MNNDKILSYLVMIIILCAMGIFWILLLMFEGVI